MISAISVFVLHVEVYTLGVKFNLLSFSLAIKYDVSGVYINGIETAVWNLLNYIMLQAKANRLYSSGHICHIVIYKKYFSDWKEMKRVVFGIWFCTNIQSESLFEFSAVQIPTNKDFVYMDNYKLLFRSWLENITIYVNYSFPSLTMILHISNHLEIHFTTMCINWNLISFDHLR